MYLVVLAFDMRSTCQVATVDKIVGQPCALKSRRNRKSGSCVKPHGEDSRLDVREMFKLSVLAMGRRVLNISARWNAGMGEVV